MKGLLLKDWYMMKKYCRQYLLIGAVFIAVSLFGDDNMFFIFYPCLLCGMIPVNLLAYDEQSRWVQYSGALPYTKAQLVSVKYLIGLFAQGTVLIVTGIAQSVKMAVNSTFVVGDFLALMLSLLAISTLTSSISLPFIFKLGVEKGRVAYYVMICAASVAASSLLRNGAPFFAGESYVLPILAVLGIGVYALSWYLSIVFYERREV